MRLLYLITKMNFFDQICKLLDFWWQICIFWIFFCEIISFFQNHFTLQVCVIWMILEWYKIIYMIIELSFYWLEQISYRYSFMCTFTFTMCCYFFAILMIFFVCDQNCYGKFPLVFFATMLCLREYGMMVSLLCLYYDCIGE